MKVAIFDFDGTIYKYETFTLLMNYMKEHPTYKEKYKSFYSSIIAPYFAYKLRIYPERKMKLNLTQKYLYIFKGKKMNEIELYFDEVAMKMVNDYHRLVIEKLNDHHKNGDFVMVVSGAFTPLLRAALKDLPVDKIIGTEIPTTNSLFDSTLQIDHVQSERKTEKILEYFADKSIDWDNSFAYGDSYADLPVLEMVGNPVAVCPDIKLQEITNKKQWSIIC